MTSINVFQIVTDRIVAQMQQGIIPWHRPWRSIGVSTPKDMAISYETGRPYSLLNQMLVGAAEKAARYILNETGPEG